MSCQKTDISQSRMNVECHIPKMFEKAKEIIKEDVCMKFYNETKLLYIETDVSGIHLGAALLQTKDNMTCHRDEVPDNNILRPIAFASKSLTGEEKGHSIIEREALGILYGLGKVSSLLLCKGGKYNQASQTTHCHIQERYSHFVTKTPANLIKNTPGQDQNLIQTWTRLAHARLAGLTKSPGK